MLMKMLVSITHFLPFTNFLGSKIKLGKLTDFFSFMSVCLLCYLNSVSMILYCNSVFSHYLLKYCNHAKVEFEVTYR